MPEDKPLKIVTWVHQSWITPKKLSWIVVVLSPQGDPPRMEVEQTVLGEDQPMSASEARVRAKEVAIQMGLPFVNSAMAGELLSELMVRKLSGRLT